MEILGDTSFQLSSWFDFLLVFSVSVTSGRILTKDPEQRDSRLEITLLSKRKERIHNLL